MEWPSWLEDWQVWLGLSLTLGAAELLSLDLLLLMLAVGALAGAVTALFPIPVVVQILVAVGTSVAMLALVRPSVVNRLHSGPTLRQGHDALVGRQAVVVDEVSALSGQIKIAGELWTARPYDETETIEPGATVDVFEIRGATAYVHKVPTLDA